MHELLLPRLKREIEARLAELRPVVAEVAALEAARAALLAERQAAGARPAAVEEPVAEAPTISPEEAARVRRAAIRTSILPPLAPIRAESRPARSVPEIAEEERDSRDVNRDTILMLVEERPGVSIAEIASVTKIDKGAVAVTVSRLKREGELADEAGGVKLASRTPLTLSSRDDGVSDREWEAAQPRSRRGALA